jgi:4-alpha-glucanotransferase
MSTLGRRRSGVLLHPTSLPDPERRGVLGEVAHRFVDLLADAGFTVWQMLPVGPTGADRSPYLSASAHAGNLDFLDKTAIAAPLGSRTELDTFVASRRSWILDDALFVALKAEQRGRPWWEWPPAVRDREPAVLQQARAHHHAAIEQFIAGQFLFHRQWQALRQHAAARGVRIFGDVPIYVAHDSAEVWTHRREYLLDARGLPLAVAGVPPDYFSQDGQLWGNPLYDWAQLEADGFSSWVARMRTQLERFDLLRLDHFRGLEAYWEVPAGAPTARAGHWRKAPGAALLQRLLDACGRLPLVAEDLGVITPEVEELRDRFGLPGMRVLQFAFDGSPQNPYLPHNQARNSVVYTGTHDNDTTLGWYRGLDANVRQRLHDYFHCRAEDLPEALVGAALMSVADLAVIPLQDLLGLGSEARMNTPGTVAGNWKWSFVWEEIPADFISHWKRLNDLYGRS